MEVNKRLKGYFEDEEVYEYTLKNKNNLSLSVVSYGGITTEIKMPDRKGKFEDITVHLDDLEEMIEDRPYHGAIIGPVAGRIRGGHYFDGEKKVQLDQNEGEKTLHGGSAGLDRKNWAVKVLEKEEEVTLLLTTIHKDLESGFPGNLSVSVSYTLNEANELIIGYEAVSDEKTIFSPTNHVYFNLAGEQKEPIYHHFLELASDYYVSITEDGLITGEVCKVEGTDYDFTEMKSLEFLPESQEKEIKEHDGLDHAFLLREKPEEAAAKIYHEKSGRMVEMYTDTEAVVVYTHNHEQVSQTKTIPKHTGITLETSGIADAMAYEKFHSILLDKDEEFHSKTRFIFSLKEE
ncbi:MAG: galactose mutarotase [Atopostipes suicloacalis]|nr:galactose mutarotase [Atopostipes suicloacalis]